jgi:hypothetical protein
MGCIQSNQLLECCDNQQELQKMPATPRIPELHHIGGRLRMRHLDLLRALYALGSVHKAAA